MDQTLFSQLILLAFAMTVVLIDFGLYLASMDFKLLGSFVISFGIVLPRLVENYLVTMAKESEPKTKKNEC